MSGHDPPRDAFYLEEAASIMVHKLHQCSQPVYGARMTERKDAATSSHAGPGSRGESLPTKLLHPRRGRKVVARPRLVSLLNDSAASKLTLLSAPAGFGKATLLAEWLHMSKRTPVWVALDDGDNDPARFFSNLWLGLQQYDPLLGQSLHGLLSARRLPGATALIKALVGELNNASHRRYPTCTGVRRGGLNARGCRSRRSITRWRPKTGSVPPTWSRPRPSRPSAAAS